MKSVVAPPETSTACLRIECTNSTTVRLTQYPVDLTMSNSEVYQAVAGYDFSGVQETASFSPSAVDLQGIMDASGITRDAVMSGIFDGAKCYLFRVNFLAPVEDYEPITASVLGKTTFEDNRFTIEEMSLIDALNQSAGGSILVTCPKTFGGTEYAGCKQTYSLATGTISSVTSQFVVRDSARGEPADWYGLGKIWFTSGANVGLKPREIQDYAADGTITVFEPFYYPVVIGDAYSMAPGCRKRLEDCRDKWANVANFGGFPDVPTSSSYAQVGNKR